MENIKERRRKAKASSAQPDGFPRVPRGTNQLPSHHGGATASARPEHGVVSATKDLYRTEKSLQPWQEWSPEEIAGIVSQSASDIDKYALVVRREKRDGEYGEPILALHSIDVQSPFLKAILHPVFKDYKSVNTNLKNLQFTAPFLEFFHQWAEFVQARPAQGNDEDDTPREHYDILFGIIYSELSPHFDRAADLLKNNVMTFDYLWALFEPGIEILSRHESVDRLWLVDRGEYKEARDQTTYEISCRYIDTDGDKFGDRTRTLEMQGFEGIKPIEELDILPSHIYSDIAPVRAMLQERGRKFEMLRGCHYKAYSGPYMLLSPPSGVPERQHMERGRVMIDSNPNSAVPSRSELLPLSRPSELAEETLSIEDGTDLRMPEPLLKVKEKAKLAKKRFTERNHKNKNSTVLYPDQHALCTPLVKGYCFKTKSWALFQVDKLTDIAWNDTAFGQLVLPHDYKSIIWAFVDAQMSQTDDDFDDIIEGKGKGIIMLLSGEPGTGKTLTSESVAEAMHKPLYSLSAGELGLTAESVERNLNRVLELSQRWKAVLLIDECDVFLENRNQSDLHRNQLVSVFLRLLEYYQGVMFLTTNRLGSFDPAFESRIDLTLHYPALDAASRRHIWRTFLPAGSDKIDVAEEELDSLAEHEFNGRQIKNVVKTARLLALRDKTALTRKHLEIVMRVKKGKPGGLENHSFH